MDTNTLDLLCSRAEELSKMLDPGEKRTRCLKMMEVLRQNPNWPDLKVGGWIEYVITVCIEAGVTTIEVERDFSRPIKHRYYASIGAEIPKTMDVLSAKEKLK